MSFIDNLQYKAQSLSILFKQGIRRSFIIFAVVCVILLAPFYFIGQFTSRIWNSSNLNPNRINNTTFVIPRTITEQPLEYSETQIVPLKNGETALYMTISNKLNDEVGFWPFVYTVQVLDNAGAILSQERTRSYLLPDDIKYVVSTSKDPSAVRLNVIREPETKAVFHNKNSPQFVSDPNISIEAQRLEFPKGSDKLKVFARFKNNGQFNVKSVEVLYIVRDTRQSVVGIGEFSFQGFLAKSERDMNLDYPYPLERTPSIADVRWSINYLDPNIITF